MNSPNHIERAVGRLRVATKAALDERVFADAAVALERATADMRQSAHPCGRHTPFDRHIVRWAAVIAVTGVVVAGGVAVWQKAGQHRQRVVQVPPPGGPNVPPQTTRLAGQRQKIDALYAARDVDGLLQALNAGRIEDRIRAARYLGEIAGPRAIAALSPLAAQWQGDPAGNPFAQAIRQIEARTRPSEPNVLGDGQSWQDEAAPGSKPEPVLTGMLTDAETGEPIPGVIVRLGSNPGHLSLTDSNGVYGFIVEDGSYSIRLEAPEHIVPADWEDSEKVELHVGEQVVRDYALERGCKLLLTMVDENGRPVAGGHVCAASRRMDRWPKEASQSEDNGVIVIGGLEPDTYLIIASHPDFALAGERITFDEPKQVKSLVLHLQPGMNVSGVAICSDGLPAEGWMIAATPLWCRPGMSWWWHSNPVAADGTFLIRHILPGPHRLDVLLPEKDNELAEWHADVNLPPESGLLDVKIPLLSPRGRASIAGTVKFTDDGSYEQEFRIRATDAAGNFTDVDIAPGRQDFVITDLAPGLYDLEIMLAGQEKEFKDVPAPSEGLVLEVAAPRLLRVRGRILDAKTHRPVTDFGLCVVDGRLRGDALSSMSRGEQEQAYHRVSDPNGAFEVHTYGPQCRAVVRADGYIEKASDDLCRDSSALAVIELELSPGVRGVVVDEAGRPVAGATVHLRGNSATAEPPIATTDGEGRFSVDKLPPDDWWCFVFRHSDYARAREEPVSVRDGAAEMRVVLSRGGTVEGRLYDGQGKPLGNTPLYFMDEPDFGYWAQGWACLGSATTDDKGFYRIEHLPEELCYVFRENPDRQLGVVQAVVMPALGRTRRCDIGGPWKAAGRLLDEGRPVARVRLLVTYDVHITRSFQAFTMTDADGRFAFYGLPTGQRSIYWATPAMERDDRWIVLGTFEFRAGVDVDLGDYEAELAEVTVEVAMEDGTLAPEGWSIVLQEHDKRDFWGQRIGLLRPRREPSEPFVFSHVPAGRFEALAEREGFPTVRMPFEVKTGEKTSRVLVTIPTGTAAVSGQTISGNDWSPYSWYEFTLRRADQGITAEVRVGADGTFRVKNLPAGHYILGWSERTSMRAEVTLGPQEHKTISIDLTRADAAREAARAAEGSLDVVVLTEEGIPLATPNVWLERAGREITPWFDGDECKCFSGDPGLYVLHAEYPGYRPVQTTVELKSEQGRTMQDKLVPLVIPMTRQ